LKGVGAAYFYTSPLDRCLNTARIAASIVGAPLEIRDDLTEVQPGESKTSMQNRLCPFFELALQTSLEKGPVALITHGGPVAVLLGQLGMDENTVKRQLIYDHRNPLPPGGAWLAEQPGTDQPWKLSLVFTPETIKTFT
jgi:broad specificity phosphatase PhoE